MNESQGQFVFSEREWGNIKKSLTFSPRQEQIARCLLSGMTDKEIADAVGITVPTVRTHLSRLFDKFDAGDRVELVLHFFRAYRKECVPVAV